MASTHAFGTTLTWDTVVIAQLTAINGVSVSAETVDVSTHQSTSAYREFLVGMLDAGEVTLEGTYSSADTTGQHAMFVDMAARESKTAIITFPSATGSTWTFTGLITSLKIGDAGLDNAIPFSATIKITGVPVFAVSASTGLTTPFFVISESAVVTPAAAGATYSYVATVLKGITSVTVKPTATAGTITVNGNTVATGVASSAIALGAAGTNTTITIVVTETGKSPKTYTILVARAAS